VQLVQTAVQADLNMFVPAGLTIIAQLPGSRRNLRVSRQDNTAVAHCPQVLGGVQARRGCSAGETSGPTVCRRPSRLSAVFDHRNAKPGQRAQRVWIKGMAIEVNRYNRSDRLVGPDSVGRQVQVQSSRLIYIAPHRCSSGSQNRKRRCECGQRRRQDPVTRLHIRAPKRDLEGVEATGHADCMRDAPPSRKLDLELTYLRSEYQPPAPSDAIDGVQGVVSNLIPLASEVVGLNAPRGRLDAVVGLAMHRRRRYGAIRCLCLGVAPSPSLDAARA
jgi:hypothetical protein